MEYHENLSLDCKKNSHGRVVTDSRAGFPLIRSVIRSFGSELLAIFLFALQFTTVAAVSMPEGVNNSFWGHLNFIGFVSAFPTAAATKSLTYSALNNNKLCLTGHIGPGSLILAAMLFEVTEIRFARLFALGGTRDVYTLVELDSPNGLHYIGLKSYTYCSIVNAVGANIVREHGSLWKQDHRPEEQDRPVGRDAGRTVKVIILKVQKVLKTEDEQQTEKMQVSLTDSKIKATIADLVPLLFTGGLIVCSFWFKERTVGVLIVLGCLGMTVAVLGLGRCFVFEYSQPKPAKGIPAGDCVVVDDRDPNVLHVIEGHETSIQALFQRKINYEPKKGKCGKGVLLAAGLMLYIYAIGSILFLASASPMGKIFFAAANLVGLVADMFKASQNMRLGLAKRAREQFEIEFKRSVVFGNRTAAVAFVAAYAADCLSLKTKKLLQCEGPVWELWWKTLPTEIHRLNQQVGSHINEGIPQDMDDGSNAAERCANGDGRNQEKESEMKELRKKNEGIPQDKDDGPSAAERCANGDVDSEMKELWEQLLGDMRDGLRAFKQSACDMEQLDEDLGSTRRLLSIEIVDV